MSHYIIYMVEQNADLHIHVETGTGAKLHAMPVDLSKENEEVVAAFEALLDGVRAYEFAKARSQS
jgi:hypothetical protein